MQAEAQEDDTKLRIKGLKVREYLMEHLGEDLSIERISKETGLSKRSIQRHFKEKYNLTVSDFIRKQRLEKARQAINKGGITVAEAAYMAGYNSPSSFSNAFKRVYGSAPKNWRA